MLLRLHVREFHGMARNFITMGQYPAHRPIISHTEAVFLVQDRRNV